ncbi:hypothetical protein F5X68DRAFT_206994 [Plectosphaerella plurivora]|uniref:Uncharacterized protein n=1 Tax=Plectosphaerella plurivora TaxID=936078 RepID=A0A9P9ACK9_9PEZI|nr:hypothetical protein F5X68DRAFT_206994 [Plectosphaerella plurivora]
MSADLLAEFDNFYSKPQQSQQQQQQAPVSSASGSTLQSVSSSADPFNFTSFGTTSHRGHGQASPPPQSWGTAQTSSSTTTAASNGWGDFSSFGGPIGAVPVVQPPQVKADDDDDGWGDFETAEDKDKSKSEEPTSPPHGRMRASTFDLMSNNLLDFNGFQHPPPPPQGQGHQRTASSISNISYVHMYEGKPTSPSPPAPYLQPSAHPPPPPPQAQRKPADPNVLFDAEDFNGAEAGDDDDDFGDFETGDNFSPAAPPVPAWQAKAQSPPPPPVSLPTLVKPKQQGRAPAPLSLDLLSLDTSPPPMTAKRTHGATLSVTSLSGLTSPTSSGYPQAPKSPSFNERNPFPGLALKTPTTPDFFAPQTMEEKEHSPTPVTAWPTFEGGVETKPEDWSPFEDKDFEPFPENKKTAKPVAPVKKAPAPAKNPPPKPVETSDSWDWDAVDTPPSQPAPSPAVAVSSAVLDSQGSDAAPPPTNIPPPSVLLSIFPQLLSLANNSLFKPLAGQSQSIKDRVTADPATATFLRAYLLIATVAARIVAGRKLRWHRDRFLSQGMAISSAGAKGMKLAGVDRTQAAREDREAADLVAVWREDVGRLRSAVAAANGAASKGAAQLKVPELAENIPVTTAKMVATAPKACVVCGLKRDERVTKVDFEVEDSFGEWWVEHWGHRACKNFWVEHEKQLRSR